MAWRPDRRSEFAARVRLPDNGPWVYVDVLSLTGPALLEHALVAYAGVGGGVDGGTRALRVGVAGEDPHDSSTWDRASFVVPPSGRGCWAAKAAGSVKHGIFDIVYIVGTISAAFSYYDFLALTPPHVRLVRY